MRQPFSSPANFVVQGGQSAFNTKAKQLADLLTQTERDCKKDKSEPSLTEPEMEMLYGRQRGSRRAFDKLSRRETRQYRGTESLFKRPELPAPRSVRRTIPDYHRNPHKWVKYSLEDVTDEQMSEASNTRAALSFLTELRERRAKEESEKIMDEESDGSALTSTSCDFTTRILFKKPASGRNAKESRVVVIERDEKPIYQNSKIILPDYIIGQKREKKVKRAKPVEEVNRSKQLKLSHLEQIDE